MSRTELAEAVNRHLWRTTGKSYTLDGHAIARYERGAVRWPGDAYRAGFRAVLGAERDADLGFRPVARGRSVGATGAMRSGPARRGGQVLPVELSPSPDGAAAAARALWGADLEHDPVPPGAVNQGPDVSAVVLRWLTAPGAVPKGREHGTLLVGPDDVAAVHRTCDLFGALDHEFGGGHARTAAVQYLCSEVGPLLRGRYTAEVGQKLFRAAARFTCRTGAMAYDAGHHALARHYFVQALDLARWGRDPALQGKALALLSHQANFSGNFRQALDLARSARRGTEGQVSPGVRAMYAAMEARALASLGEERACTGALDQMERLFLARDGEQEPEWMDYFDDSELQDEFAHCFHDLGRPRQARRCARDSRDRARQGFRRSRTFAGLVLAGSYVSGREADVEEACRTAEDVVTEAGPMRSARVESCVRRFDERLEPFADTDAVRAFRSRLRTRLDGAGPERAGLEQGR